MYIFVSVLFISCHIWFWKQEQLQWCLLTVFPSDLLRLSFWWNLSSRTFWRLFVFQSNMSVKLFREPLSSSLKRILDTIIIWSWFSFITCPGSCLHSGMCQIALFGLQNSSIKGKNRKSLLDQIRRTQN